jgi:hypothetical protein
MFKVSTRISSIPALVSYSIDNCGGQHALMQKILRICWEGEFAYRCPVTTKATRLPIFVE